MDTLSALVRDILETPLDALGRSDKIAALATHILRRRVVCRLRRGRAPDGIYASVLEMAYQHLTQTLEQGFAENKTPPYPWGDWAKGLRSQAFQSALTPANLQAMAIAAQHHEPRTPDWQYAITELITALKESGRLAKLSQLSLDLREEATHRTLQWVVEHLQNYDSGRGGFIQWVNYRLGMIAQTVQGEQQNDLNQKLYQGIARYQYQLKRMLMQVRVGWICCWLGFYLKGIVPDVPGTWHYVLMLTILFELATVVHQNPNEANSFLRTAAQALLNVPEGVVPLPDTMTIEDKAVATNTGTDLPNQLREYIQTDPRGIFQNHVKGYPSVTFQVIMLARLDTVPWGNLSEKFGIPIATLSTFFQRQLKKHIPIIRQDFEY